METTRYSYPLKETKRFPLGENAKRYMKETLNGGSYFSGLLLDGFMSSDGIVFTYMPEGTKIEKIKNFRHSVFMYGGVERKTTYLDTRQALVEFIAEYLSKDESRVYLIEDLMQRSKDSCKIIEGLSAITFQDRCYYMLTHKDAKNIDRIRRVISFTHTWAFEGILSHMTRKNESEFEGKDVQSVIANLEFIVIGAFDLEGYVIWEKSK